MDRRYWARIAIKELRDARIALDASWSAKNNAVGASSRARFEAVYARYIDAEARVKDAREVARYMVATRNAA